MKTHINRARRHFRLKHDLLILILVVILCTFAVLSAVAWLIAHVLILAGVALIIGAAYYGGRLHERRQMRPHQVQQQACPAGPTAAQAVPTATMSLSGNWDEAAAGQRPAGQADRTRLLADPRSGVRPLSQLRGS